MIKFTEEQKQFIYENYKGIGNKELTEMFNRKFGTSLDKQIKYFKKNHNLDSGLTGKYEKGNIPYNQGKKWDEYMPKKSQEKAKKTTFKKGNMPHNYRLVGSERINADGYIEVKIADPNKWEMKHRVIYEEHYGTIPKGYNVMFADGNKLNLEIDNLILISKSEDLIMNKNKLFYQNKELTKTGHLIAKIISKRSGIKNERL